MSQTKTKYIKEDDTLEIIFKKNKVPEVLKLSTGVMLEFDKKTLTAIILPRFFQVINLPPNPNAKIVFKKMLLNEDETELKLVLGLDKKTINLKINLIEIEKYK